MLIARGIPHALLVALVVMMTRGTLGAQEQARTVHGVVTDGRKQPLEHAAVQIENNWTLVIRSYITQADGKYHFAGLNPDVNYTLTAEYDGIRSASRTLSKFDSHRNRKIDLTIHLGK